MSETNVPCLKCNEKGGQYVNLNRDIDNDAKFSGNLYIA